MQNYREGGNFPPRHVYSAIVENLTSATINVTATYQTPPDGHKETCTQIIAPNAKAVIPQKVVDIDLMQSTAHIEGLNITQEGSPKTFSGVAPWGIWSPVRDFQFVVTESEEAPGGLAVAQPQRHANT